MVHPKYTQCTHRSNKLRYTQSIRNVSARTVHAGATSCGTPKVYAMHTPEQQVAVHLKYTQCTHRSNKLWYTQSIHNVHTRATSCGTPKVYTMHTPEQQGTTPKVYAMFLPELYTPEQQVAVHPKYTQCFCQKCTRRSNKLRYTQSIRNVHTGATSCGTPKVYAMYTPEQQVAVHLKYTQCTHTEQQVAVHPKYT